MCSIKESILCAKNLGYSALGLVDKNVLSGAMSFKKECEKQGIKPIFGLEVDLKLDESTYPIILYALNDDGFKKLMGLSSFIMTKDQESIDLDILNKYRDNNLLVFEADNMPITSLVDKGEDPSNLMNKIVELFGNNFLIGLMDHDIVTNKNRDIKIKEIAKKYNIKTVALNRTFYLNKEDAYEFEILKCIKDKTTLDKNVLLEEGRYLLNKEEFSRLYDEEEIKNTDVLASLCNVKLDFKTSLPKYDLPNNISSKDYLVSLSKEGLRRRLNNKVTKEYAQRLEYELSVILKMHFEDYFLIVYDFILYAKKQGIMVGPARGSAAGSLVSYCLGITDIDPLKYGLLFERFLNPERVSMPDIDTDFPDDRRDEVFDYVSKKYGKDHVAHIITYGTLKAKQVLRDVGRVLNYSVSELDSITKLIPFAPNMTLDYAKEVNPIFKQKIESEKKYRELFDISKKLEGFPRHSSTHAAGIVFSKEKLSDVVPMIKIENDLDSTQYTMEHLEEMGLIKMDFLGLRNLGIIAEIVDDVKKNVKQDFNIKTTPLDDKKTFELIDNVNLLGVFQLESNGMQNLTRKMKPRSFEELSMMIALFRPGPMENIPMFLKNRENPSSIRYLVPALKPILEETYGIIVYQEQIMTIARVIAGFSYGKADVLRRAMSKKKPEELQKLYGDFINGCVANGYDKTVANSLYELIFKFANYGFNKSHSIAYGMVAYQMAYLKANYPLYFYKALLNGVIGSEQKTYDYIKECQGVGVSIKLVSINNSNTSYIIKDNSIIMPFGIVRDVGSIASNKIVDERKTNGLFKDYLDAVLRLTIVGVDKTALANLISAGAFDEFKMSRYSMLNGLENALKYANTHKKESSLIEGIDDRPIIENLKDNKTVLANKEKEVLGFYFTYNPILEYKKEHGINCLSILEIIETKGYVKGFGIIRRVKEIKTKRGELMCFIDVMDDTASISLAVMPNIYKANQDIIKEDKYIEFEGQLEKEDSILVKKLKEA